jgi:hypothetical protein
MRVLSHLTEGFRWRDELRLTVYTTAPIHWSLASPRIIFLRHVVADEWDSAFWNRPHFAQAKVLLLPARVRTFSGLILLVACGGGGASFGNNATNAPGTPAEAYTITVSPSGSVTQTTTVALAVK